MDAYYPFKKLVPPEYVTDKDRWHRIDPQRRRCGSWLMTSTFLRVGGWVLSIGTVVVAAIAAGRPGFIAANWSDDATVRSWATSVAIMSGLAGLIPWQKAARAFERAHEALADAITLFDADTTFTVAHVLNVAREAAKELQLDDRKSAAPIPHDLHGPHE